MGTASEHRPHPALCVGVIATVALVCLVASVRGHDRFNQYTWYVYDNGDPGHPGLVNVLAATAFWTISVLSAIIATVVRRVPWLAGAILFLVIGVDYLVRFHNGFTGGDVSARLIYWIVFAYVLRHLWRSTFLTTRVLIVAAMAFFALSDVFDLFSSEIYGRGAALEESTGCLGAWCLALAVFGLGQMLLSARQPVVTPTS